MSLVRRIQFKRRKVKNLVFVKDRSILILTLANGKGTPDHFSHSALYVGSAAEAREIPERPPAGAKLHLLNCSLRDVAGKERMTQV